VYCTGRKMVNQMSRHCEIQKAACSMQSKNTCEARMCWVKKCTLALEFSVQKSLRSSIYLPQHFASSISRRAFLKLELSHVVWIYSPKADSPVVSNRSLVNRLLFFNANVFSHNMATLFINFLAVVVLEIFYFRNSVCFVWCITCNEPILFNIKKTTFSPSSIT